MLDLNTEPDVPIVSLLQDYIELVFFLAEAIHIVDAEVRAQLLFEASINLSPETLRELKAELIALRHDESQQLVFRVAA